MKTEKLRELEEKIGYQFQDMKLLRNALTHSSYANEHRMPRFENNERLEFLGDAVLELVSSEFLFNENKEAAVKLVPFTDNEEVYNSLLATDTVMSYMLKYGNPSLGINASNEEFLKLHPNWAREYYSLSNFNPSSIEICPSEQEIRDELEQLTPIIEGTELRLDYGEKVSKEDYEKYEAAIARRTTLTSMLGEDTPTPELTMN